MNKTIFFILVVAVQGLAPWRPAAAGTAGGPAGSISLDTCLNLAFQENPQVLSYYESLAASRESERMAFGSMLPEVNLSWTGRDYWDGTDDYHRAALSLEQPLFRGKDLYLQWQVSKMNLTRADLEVARQLQKIRRDVKTGWYGLLAALSLEAETRKALDRLHRHVANARLFFREGWIWRTDVLQAQVELARGEKDLISAQNDVLLAKSRLNVLINRDVDRPVRPAGELEWEKTGWTYASALETALSGRPDLAQARIDHEKSKAAVEIARCGYWPTLKIEAAASRSGNTLGMRNGTDEQSLTVSSTFNIWDWGKTKSGLGAAVARMNQSRLLLLHLKNTIQLEVQEAWLSLQEAEQKIHVLKKTFEQSEENFRVNQIRYRERLGTAKDVLDAQDLLTTTRKDHISAVAAYMISLAGLEFSLGGPVEKK